MTGTTLTRVPLDRAARRLVAGGMAIGGSADYHAQWLRDECGVNRTGDYPSLEDVRSALVAL